MSETLKGICRLSVVPMRAKPASDASLISELLFGEHYTVLDDKDNYLYIQLDFDCSTGWISKTQHTPISEEYFDHVSLSDYKVCIDISGTIFFQKKHVHILLGSILPITTHELFKMEEQVAFNGESKSLSQKREFEYMAEVIKKYLHAPFLQGGKTPFGIDEGGFIQQVFKICGYKLPRTIAEQCMAGQEVTDMDTLIPGDILFTKGEKHLLGFICMGEGQYVGVLEGQVSKLSADDVEFDASTVRRVLYKNPTSDQA